MTHLYWLSVNENMGDYTPHQARYWNTKQRFRSVDNSDTPGQRKNIQVYSTPAEYFYKNISEFNGWTIEYVFEGLVVLCKGMPENNLNTNVKPQTKSTFNNYR